MTFILLPTTLFITSHENVQKIPGVEERYVKAKLFMYMILQCLEFFMQTKKMLDLNLGLEMLHSYLNKEHLCFRNRKISFDINYFLKMMIRIISNYVYKQKKFYIISDVN